MENFQVPSTRNHRSSVSKIHVGKEKNVDVSSRLTAAPPPGDCIIDGSVTECMNNRNRSVLRCALSLAKKDRPSTVRSGLEEISSGIGATAAATTMKTSSFKIGSAGQRIQGTGEWCGGTITRSPQWQKINPSPSKKEINPTNNVTQISGWFVNRMQSNYKPSASVNTNKLTATRKYYPQHPNLHTSISGLQSNVSPAVNKLISAGRAVIASVVLFMSSQPTQEPTSCMAKKNTRRRRRTKMPRTPVSDKYEPI